MFESIPTDFSGYKLLHNGNGIYKLISSHGAFTGNANEVATHAVLEHGFSKEEIDLGMSVMSKRFHNAAEFGIFKSFMWSYDLEETRETFNTVH